MMSPSHALTSFAGLCLALAGATLARADDWPQWRGPQRDGHWRETGLLEKFPAGQLKPTWTAPIGPGYAGPTVAGDRVFVMDRVKSPEQERVLAFDRTTGKQLWAHAYPCVYRDIDFATGPRASVTIADGRAFSLGAMGHAHALNVADGSVIWTRDLAADFKAIINLWGFTSAPLVVGDLVILQIGGQPDAVLVALDAQTGRERWRALDGRASYSPPQLVNLGGQDAILAWTAEWLALLDPATGQVRAKHPYKKKNMILNVADPVLDEGRRQVFLTAFYDGAHLFDLTPGAIDLKWRRAGFSEVRTDALHSIMMTPIVRDGHAYGVDSHGEVRCINLTTGDRVWEDTSLLQKARWATAHFVQNGDRTWITTEKGEIVIARLTPQGFERISSAQFITPETDIRGRDSALAWAHPAYAHRSLFARSESLLVCISLAATP